MKPRLYGKFMSPVFSRFSNNSVPGPSGSYPKILSKQVCAKTDRSNDIRLPMMLPEQSLNNRRHEKHGKFSDCIVNFITCIRFLQKLTAGKHWYRQFLKKHVTASGCRHLSSFAIFLNQRDKNFFGLLPDIQLRIVTGQCHLFVLKDHLPSY